MRTARAPRGAPRAPRLRFSLRVGVTPNFGVGRINPLEIKGEGQRFARIDLGYCIPVLLTRQTREGGLHYSYDIVVHKVPTPPAP